MHSMNTEPGNGVNAAQERILGYMPERCQACPVLGELALMYAMLEDKQALTGTKIRSLTRAQGGRTANRCKGGVNSDGTCGSIDPSPIPGEPRK